MKSLKEMDSSLRKGISFVSILTALAYTAFAQDNSLGRISERFEDYIKKVFPFLQGELFLTNLFLVKKLFIFMDMI